MARRNDNLFSNDHLHKYLDGTSANVVGVVNQLPRDQFMASSDDQLVDHFLETYCPAPIVLDETAASLTEIEEQVDIQGRPDYAIWGHRGPALVPGIGFRVEIPFAGTEYLWKLRPSSSKLVHPFGTTKNVTGDGGVLELKVVQPAGDPPEKIQRHLNDQLELIRFYVAAQHSEVQAFRAQLESTIKQTIANRRKRIEVQQGIAKSINIPLKERAGVPAVPIPVRRKLPRPLPTPPKAGFSPEPGISDETYEHILNVIRHECRTFESAPQTFRMHDEPGLRDIILAHLNSHYEGLATGETFRKLGKTDIRIEMENRAAFVGECKVWEGAKACLAALDQLLGYLTWRDCKACLVVFNKHNSSFSELLEKIPTAMVSHSQVRKQLPSSLAGEWRFEVAAPGDEGRTLLVHLFVADLFVRT